MRVFDKVQELSTYLLDTLRIRYFLKMDCPSMCALHRIATGSDEDVIIFNNAGGQPFHVWTGDVAKEYWKARKIKSDRTSSLGDYIYAARIGGKEVVTGKAEVSDRGVYLSRSDA